jgi:carboxypeptidase Taq
MNAYAALEAHYGRIGRLDDALEILFWDMATMMPKGGAEGRAETLATMKVLRHELAADPALAERFEGGAGPGRLAAGEPARDAARLRARHRGAG